MTNLQSDTPRQPNQQDNEEDENLDLGALIATILNEKYLIASVALIFLGLGVFKTQLTIPSYKADAMMQVEEKSNGLNALSGVMEIMDSPPLALTEIEIIKSRQILGAAVKELHLDIVATPQYFPIIGKAIARRFQAKNLTGEVSTPLFGMDQYAWGGEKIQLDTLSVPDSLIGKGLVLLAGEQGHFTLKDENDQTLLEGEVGKPVIKKLDNNEDSVNLFISSLKARKGTQFTVTRKPLLSAITELDKSLTIAEKGKKTGILSFSIEDPSAAKAAKILNQVTNNYVKQNVEQKSKEAQTTLEFLDKQLPSVKEQLEAATTALNEFRTQKGSIDLTIETGQILNSIVEITGQLTLLQQQKDELRGRFTEAHPTVLALDKQIARLQGQINSHDKKIETLPETQQVILRLTRDVEVSSELYTALLNSAQTLRVAKAGTVGNVRIIDEAVLPTGPVDSKKSLIIAVSLILGLVVGVGIAFIRKALHRGVE
ncbi:MAG: GNVR domain-containing protein, partial [Methylococcaceae bacterium]